MPNDDAPNLGTLYEKPQLTDSELVILINGENSAHLRSVEKITDRQAEILSHLRIVILPKVRELTDHQAELLGQVRELMLGVTKVTDCQIMSLSNCHSVSFLELKEITADQCRYLQNVPLLSFHRLTSISLAAATILGKSVVRLGLNGLSEIDPESIAALNATPILFLSGLETLSDAQAEGLGKRGESMLFLDGLQQLTERQTEMLSNCSDLSLVGLSSITDRQAEFFGRCRWLALDGLTQISEQAASHLCTVKNLYLYGIEKLSDRQAQILSKCETVRVGRGAEELLAKYKR